MGFETLWLRDSAPPQIARKPNPLRFISGGENTRFTPPGSDSAREKYEQAACDQLHGNQRH